MIFFVLFYVMRTGIPWRDLPDRYGAWHTIYTRFKRWSASGWFWKLLQRLPSKEISKPLGSIAIVVHRDGSGSLKKKERWVEEEKD